MQIDGDRSGGHFARTRCDREARMIGADIHEQLARAGLREHSFQARGEQLGSGSESGHRTHGYQQSARFAGDPC